MFFKTFLKLLQQYFLYCYVKYEDMKEYTSKTQLVEILKNQMLDDGSTETNPEVAKRKAECSRRQIEKGIQRIYEYQTSSEQVSKDVKLHNGVGFKTTDAYILSSFAVQLNKGHHLSAKQMHIAKRLMPKYAGQLVRQSLEKGLIQKTKTGYTFAAVKPNAQPKKEEPKWTEADERRWIEYKNEFARLEAEQEQRAFEAKMRYEMSLNR